MTQRRFSFILPVDWWRIPLHDETQREKAIENLLDRQMPSKDEFAKLRQELRTELRNASAQAAKSGGLVTAMYMAAFDNQPFSASMTCYDVSGVISLPPEIDPKKILAAFVGDKELDASLPPLGAGYFPEGVEMPEIVLPEPTPSEDSELPQKWDKVTDYDVLDYRREGMVSGTTEFGEEVAKIPILQFQYFQMVPDFGIVQTTFGTPVSGPKDAWRSMFDAIIATFRNGEPADDSAATATLNSEAAS